MNYKKKDLIKFEIGFFLYMIVGIIFLSYIDNSIVSLYLKEYKLLCFSYFLLGILFLWVIISKRIVIFEPFILISVLYFCLFIFTPMIFIITGETDAHGSNIMNGAIKATIIFDFSYISFVIGYCICNVKSKVRLNKMAKINWRIDDKQLKIAIMAWGVAYVLSLVHLIGSGKNIIQILTIGSVNSTNTYGMNSMLGFISNFSFCMIVPWLYICFFSKSKFFKVVVTYLTLSAYLIRGFRYIVIIMIISFVIMYYKKKEATPKLVTCILGLIGMLIFIGALGFMRNGIRTGVKTDWSSFGINNIIYALESNFDIYKTFYGIVDNYPKYYNYTFGRSMFFETIIMFIPRMFWPSKPLALDASVVLAIRRSVSEFAIINAAMATPNIGEFYVDFGIVGCIVFMFILGFVAKWVTKFYFKNSIDDIVLYSIIMPTFLQLVIRGYTPSNFYLVVFLIMPIYIIKMANRVKV